jgi:hypothetical protein
LLESEQPTSGLRRADLSQEMVRMGWLSRAVAGKKEHHDAPHHDPGRKAAALEGQPGNDLSEIIRHDSNS